VSVSFNQPRWCINKFNQNLHISNFTQIHAPEVALFYADGQTLIMRVIDTFRDFFAKASKNEKALRHIRVLKRGYRHNQRPPHILVSKLGVYK